MRLPTYSFCSLAHTTARACILPLSAIVWHSTAAQTAAVPATQPTTVSTAPPGIEHAANPTAKVPAVPYRSVFKETSLGVEKDTEDWRKANNEVGKFLRGHVDILKWEEQESAKTMPAPAPKPMTEPATQAPSTTAPTRAPLRKEELMQPGTTPKPIAAPAHKH